MNYELAITETGGKLSYAIERISPVSDLHFTKTRYRYLKNNLMNNFHYQKLKNLYFRF